jgi:hypothetical protein
MRVLDIVYFVPLAGGDTEEEKGAQTKEERLMD